MTLYRRQWSGLSPRKRNAKKAKWLTDEALQIAEKRRDMKGKGGEERLYPYEYRVSIARRDKK